jgi:uncharacterized integral membrane protein
MNRPVRSFSILFIALMVAAWVGAIAILSVQNFGSVSLRLISFQSVPIPLGIVLAFGVMLGMVGTALIQLLPTAPTDSER